MDVYLAITSKREVRGYADRPLPDEVVERILEAGRVSGSAGNRQARRFVVLDTTREQAARCVHSPSNVLGCALAIAIVVQSRGPAGFDAGRAAQNMMLAAWNDGVGSCPNGVAGPERLAGLLALADGEQVAIILSFGYPARPPDPGRQPASEWAARADRRALEEIVQRL